MTDAKSGDIGILTAVDQSGGGSVQAFCPVLPGIDYVPMKNEILFTDGTAVYPINMSKFIESKPAYVTEQVRKNVFPAGGYLTPEEDNGDPLYPLVNKVMTPQQYLLNHYATYKRSNADVYSSPAKVELRRSTVLDTALHRNTSAADKADPDYVPNYGIVFGCMTQMLFSKPMNTNATDNNFIFEDITEELTYQHDEPFWRVNATWTLTDVSEGTLTLTPVNSGVTIYYTLDGTDPTDDSTEYTGPLTVTGGTQIKFIPYNDPTRNGRSKGPCVYDLTISTFVNSFTMQFPTIGYDGNDTSSAIGSNDFDGMVFRYATYNPDDEPLDDSTYVRPALSGSDAAIGTKWDGLGFLPSPLEETYYTVGCWRYGMVCHYGTRYETFNPGPSRDSRVESNTKFKVQVKIGKIAYDWDGTNQLTLTCSDGAATIRYSTDGSAPSTTYAGPITITDTTTVKADATRDPEKVDSDVFSHTVTFSGTTPPEAFVKSYWSSIPEEQEFLYNRTSTTRPFAIVPMTRPEYYVSSGGGGSGLTPDSPGSWQTILGYLDTDVPLAESGDTVWCSEGTYVLPIEEDDASFRIPEGVRVLGGFNSTFTKRDIQNQRSELHASTYDYGDPEYPYVNLNLTRENTDAWYDGFQLFLTYVTDVDGYGNTTSVPGNFINCIIEDFRIFAVGGDRPSPEVNYNFNISKWVAGKININVTAPNGESGEPSGPSDDLRGRSTSFSVYLGDDFYNCHDMNITLIGGNGGDASASTTFHQVTINAGSSNLYASGMGDLYNCSGTISVIGGQAGSVPPGSSMERAGSAFADFSCGAVYNSNLTIDVSSGNGGNAGQETQSTRSGGWSGGTSEVFCAVGSAIFSTLDVNTESGDGGKGSFKTGSPSERRGVGGSSYNITSLGTFSSDYENSIMSDVNMTALLGQAGSDQTESLRQGITDGQVYIGGMTSLCTLNLTSVGGSFGARDFAASVVFATTSQANQVYLNFGLLDLDELNLAETPNNGCQGNPVRRDGTAGSDVSPGGDGWYSGNGGADGGAGSGFGGAGVPLDGYETPGSGGTVETATKFLCPPPPAP